MFKDLPSRLATFIASHSRNEAVSKEIWSLMELVTESFWGLGHGIRQIWSLDIAVGWVCHEDWKTSWSSWQWKKYSELVTSLLELRCDYIVPCLQKSQDTWEHVKTGVFQCWGVLEPHSIFWEMAEAHVRLWSWNISFTIKVLTGQIWKRTWFTMHQSHFQWMRQS